MFIYSIQYLYPYSPYCHPLVLRRRGYIDGSHSLDAVGGLRQFQADGNGNCSGTQKAKQIGALQVLESGKSRGH